jgi:hypothetical protein
VATEALDISCQDCDQLALQMRGFHSTPWCEKRRVAPVRR